MKDFGKQILPKHNKPQQRPKHLPNCTIDEHPVRHFHYGDVIMVTIASQITSLTIVY